MDSRMIRGLAVAHAMLQIQLHQPQLPTRLGPPRRSFLHTPLFCSNRFARLTRALALGGAVVAGVFSAFAQSANPAHGVTAEEKQQGYSNRTFLAKGRANASEAQLALAESREGIRLRRSVRQGESLRILEASAAEPIMATIERLRASGNYEFVEPDYVVKADATPNDPRFLATDQWSLRNIGQSNGTAGADISAEAAWDIRSSAADIVVAVIDSGIRRTHEDLAANLWVNPGESGGSGNNLRDDDGNGYIDDVNGINSSVASNTLGNGSPIDGAGHGTAVASVIGAVGNNGVGMAGVAWNVKLMSLRFLDLDGFGFISDE